MSFKTTLALLLLLGLVAGVWYFTKPSHVDPIRRDEPLLPELAWEDVDAIKVLSLNRTTEYLFERRPDGSFWMTEPVKDLASEAWLNSLRGIYGGARRKLFKRKADVTEKDLKDTGLVEPRARAEFRVGGRATKVDVGEESLVEPGIFARVEGDIFLSTSALYSGTQVNVDDAREKLFFRASPFDLKSLSITRESAGKKETLRFERTGAEEFGLVAPVKARANAAATSSLIALVLGMRATRFVSGRPRDLSEIGLDPPAYRIELETQVFKESVDLGRAREGEAGVHAILPARGVVAVVELRDLAAFLETPLEDFRSRYLFPGPANQAFRIRIDAGGSFFTLQRKAQGGHELLAPVKRATNPIEVGSLMEAMDGLHVTKFVGQGPPPPEAGLSGDVLRIEMTPEGPGSKPVVVRLGATKGDAVFARRDDEDWTVLVSSKPLERLRLPWTTYVAKKVFERPMIREDIERVEVASGGKTVRTIRRDGTSWTEEPARSVGAPFAEIFERLSDLVAASAVPGLASEVLKDAAPDMVLTFIRQEPGLKGPEAVLHTIEFYKRGNETWIHVGKDVVVFVVKQFDTEQLLALKS